MALSSPLTSSHVARYLPEIPALDGFRSLTVLIVTLSHVGLQKVVSGQFGVTLLSF